MKASECPCPIIDPPFSLRRTPITRLHKSSRVLARHANGAVATCPLVFNIVTANLNSARSNLRGPIARVQQIARNERFSFPASREERTKREIPGDEYRCAIYHGSIDRIRSPRCCLIALFLNTSSSAISKALSARRRKRRVNDFRAFSERAFLGPLSGHMLVFFTFDSVHEGIYLVSHLS